MELSHTHIGAIEAIYFGLRINLIQSSYKACKSHQANRKNHTNEHFFAFSLRFAWRRLLDPQSQLTFHEYQPSPGRMMLSFKYDLVRNCHSFESLLFLTPLNWKKNMPSSLPNDRTSEVSDSKVNCRLNLNHDKPESLAIKSKSIAVHNQNIRANLIRSAKEL